MKKTKFGKLRAVICAMLSLCLAVSFAACGKKDGGGFKLNTTTATVDVGAQVLLSVTGNDSAVVWVSDNEAVATVAQISDRIDTSARVAGVSVGTATISAISGDNTATCTVTVTSPETISITKDGSAAPSIVELSGQNATVQLGATSSKGHEIAWESSDELIATVSNTGLVTAVAKGGTATITAKCAGTDNNTGSIKSSVTVKVGDGVSTSYDIPYDESPIDPAKQGKWTQWSEFDNVSSATYVDGVITITFNNNGARMENIQLRYLPTAADNLVPGNIYEVSFDAELTFPEGFEKPSGRVTVNGSTVTLTAGTGHYSVGYVQEILGFTMLMGYDNGEAGGAWDLVDATITISNIVWTEKQPTQLAAPTFSITNNVISIQDTNDPSTVKEYILALYQGNVKVGEVIVTNGATIDVSKIMVNGDFTGKLRAVAASPLYADSVEATSTSGTVKVENEHVEYELPYNSGVPAAGTWAYWSEYWVVWTARTCYDGEVTVTFSNNTGNWYDTQLKYKSLHAVGERYSIKLHINVKDGAGRVTINGQVYTLQNGDNTISLDITETSDASVAIVFGVYNENKGQEIKADTVTLRIEEVS